MNKKIYVALQHRSQSFLFTKASSNAGAFIPEAVDMLTTIECISPLKGWCPGQDTPQEIDLPLISDALETSESKIVEKDIAPGRKLYLAFSSHAMLER